MSQADRVRDAFTAQAGFFGPGSHFASGEVADWIDAAARLTPADLVLDAGGGAGDLSRTLAARARQFVVADLTPGMLERGRDLAAGAGVANVLFARAALEDLPFAAASFDVVLCRLVLHHLEDPRAALAEIARVLRAGGRAVIADMVVTGEVAERQNALERLRDPSHTRGLTEGELRIAVEGAGLAIASVEDRHVRLEFDDWLARGRPLPAAEREVRRAVAAELVGGEPTGLDPREDGTIAHRWLRVLAAPGDAPL